MVLIEDLCALNRYMEKPDESLLLNSIYFLSKTMLKRLAIDGFISSDFAIKSDTKSRLYKIRKQFEGHTNGVPFSKKPKGSPKRILYAGPWYTGTVRHKKIVTNGSLLYVGGPDIYMKATQADGKIRQRSLPGVVAEGLKVKYTQKLFPHTYALMGMSPLDIVWLSNKNQTFFVPIQARYYDFLINKFKTGVFYGGKDEPIVQMRCKNHGFSGDVVALIQSISILNPNIVKTPNKRIGFMGASNDKEM